MIEAAALDRVVDFARAVGRDDDRRWRGRANGAELGNRDLVVRQHFEQVRLEGFVGAIELVDQEHRRDSILGRQRLQQRPAQQEARGEDFVRELAALDAACRLGEPDLDHLPRVVPLVDGRRGVEALVALQTYQPPAEARRQHLGDFGLADPRLALEEERPAQLQREKYRGREAPVGDVVLALE